MHNSESNYTKMEGEMLRNLKGFKVVIIGWTLLAGLCYATNPDLDRWVNKYEKAKNGEGDDISDSTSARAEITYRIGKTRDTSAIPILIDILLNDPFPCVRAEATAALEKIGSKNALPALISALAKDRSIAVQINAAAAIFSLHENDTSTYKEIYKIARAQNKAEWNTKGFYKKSQVEFDPTISEKFKNKWQTKAIELLDKIPTIEAKAILFECTKSQDSSIAGVAKLKYSNWLKKHSEAN
jgi:HEAT repeat protein